MQQLFHALTYDSTPQYIICYRNCIYGEVAQRQLEELEIQGVLTSFLLKKHLALAFGWGCLCHRYVRGRG
jgi:hypothetical protein